MAKGLQYVLGIMILLTTVQLQSGTRSWCVRASSVAAGCALARPRVGNDAGQAEPGWSRPGARSHALIRSSRAPRPTRRRPFLDETLSSIAVSMGLFKYGLRPNRSELSTRASEWRTIIVALCKVSEARRAKRLHT